MSNTTILHIPATQKIFYMQPEYDDPGGLYMKYNPMTGIQTAAILGSFLLVLMTYVIYKARCRENQWTSTDQLYLENYKKRMTAWHERKKNNANYSRLTKDGCLKPDPAAMQATANWIQTQPLQAAMPVGSAIHLAMCNICLQGLAPSSARECQTEGAVATSDTQTYNMSGADLCFMPLPTVRNMPNHNEAPSSEDDVLLTKEMKWQKERKGRKNRKKSNNIPMEYLNLHLDTLGNSAVAPVKSDPVPLNISNFDGRMIEHEKKPGPHPCSFCDRDLFCITHNQNSIGNHFLHMPAVHQTRSAQSSLTELHMAADLDHNFHNDLKSLKNLKTDPQEKEILNSISSYGNSVGPHITAQSPQLTRITPMLAPSSGNHITSTIFSVTRPNSIPLSRQESPIQRNDSKCDASKPVIGESDTSGEPIIPQVEIIIGEEDSSEQLDKITECSAGKDSIGDTISLSDPTQSIFELTCDLDFIDATPPDEEEDLSDIEIVIKGV